MVADFASVAFVAITGRRSLGDSIGESVGVFAEPEQLVLNVSKHDKFIVIASDGVFEFITSHKVGPASVVVLNEGGRGGKRSAAEFTPLVYSFPYRTFSLKRSSQ